MSLDVVDLRNFYAQPLGTVARRFVSRGIRSALEPIRARSGSPGIGYATPYLGLFREEAERCLAFMPAAQGVVKWPSARPTLTALVEELDLPLADAAVDRVLLVHALEMSHDAEAMLREVWRVLARGRAAACRDPEPARRVGAHRHDAVRPWPALFAFADHHAVARDLVHADRLGRSAVRAADRARWFLRSAVAWERTGATLSAPFAGVHIVEATKQVYRAIPARRERRRLVPALEPVLAPSPGGAARSASGCSR